MDGSPYKPKVLLKKVNIATAMPSNSEIIFIALEGRFEMMELNLAQAGEAAHRSDLPLRLTPVPVFEGV